MEILVIALTLAGMALGGDQFVRGAAAIGRRLGMTPILVGSTIVAIGTSLPEWGVSAEAAFKGLPDLSAGNVVGSNVFNLCLIMGLVGLLRPFRAGLGWLPRDGFVMLLATFALLVVCVDGTITRAEGIGLLALFIGTMVAMIVSGRGEEEGRAFRWWDVPRAAFALGLIFVSTHFFIGAAEALAKKAEVSEWIIGITIAAVGTSLPELVTSIAAAIQRRPAIVMGNLIGSNTANIFMVLGSAATIHPLSSGRLGVAPAVIFGGVMLLAVTILAVCRGLTRPAGALLCLSGLAWYAVELMSS